MLLHMNVQESGLNPLLDSVTNLIQFTTNLSSVNISMFIDIFNCAGLHLY